ncbi:hypothetical protein Mgra_00008762 [Meloidogyne graminicola]|uniref:Uncharacterized protein n=1 Tax=Meloidogyne graminicola TaxID=189291 RepID=A0A8S9ZEY1_9BILA|nr:hypothetical protein Mgra_00008762 [Meloidogyne graminicola]
MITLMILDILNEKKILKKKINFNIAFLILIFINNYLKIFSFPIENNKIQSSSFPIFGEIIKRNQPKIINKIGFNKINKNKTFQSRMTFWAINTYLLNLYASSFNEENIQEIRNNFYKETYIDVKLLLRKQIEEVENKEEKEYIKLGVTRVTKYLIKQIYKNNKVFIGGGCFEHFGKECIE